MVAMPSITSALVAKVQKKSRLRKAEKKPRIAGSRRPHATATTTAPAPRIRIGHISCPSGAMRMAIHDATATTAATALTATPPSNWSDSCRTGGFGGSLIATRLMVAVMRRTVPTAA